MRAWVLLRFLVKALLLAAGAMAVVGAIVYLFPPPTLERWASWVTVAGGGLILLGLFSVLGGWSFRGEWKYVMSQTTSDQRLPGRVAQTARDVAGSYNFMLLMLLAGGVCVAVGVLFQRALYGG
jgi:hypothetical protein